MPFYCVVELNYVLPDFVFCCLCFVPIFNFHSFTAFLVLTILYYTLVIFLFKKLFMVAAQNLEIFIFTFNTPFSKPIKPLHR